MSSVVGSMVGLRLSRTRIRLKVEMVAMMDTVFRERRLPIGFTFRVVAAIKRVKIYPMQRMAELPLGLSLITGAIITALCLCPHLSLHSLMVIPADLLLPVETKVLKDGEIPVNILRTSQVWVISSKQGDGSGGEIQSREGLLLCHLVFPDPVHICILVRGVPLCEGA